MSKQKIEGTNKSTQAVVSPWTLFKKRFFRNKLAIAGISLLIFLFLFSFVGPLISPYGEYQVFYVPDGSLYLINNPPSWAHWLGTDKNGMDVLVRIMYGGRISLTIGFAVVSLEMIIGITLGGIAGYYGKIVDEIIMRIVDVFNCIPFLPIMMIFGSILGALKVDSTQRIYYLMVVMGLLGWPSIARLVRGQILSIREMEFMVATEAIGLKPVKRIFKHLIPNVVPQLIVIGTMGLGSIILTESTLSFLGLGVNYPLASWGNMINAINDTRILQNYLFIWVPPGICILLAVLAFNFMGDGLRDALDPKMKR